MENWNYSFGNNERLKLIMGGRPTRSALMLLISEQSERMARPFALALSVSFLVHPQYFYFVIQTLLHTSHVALRHVLPFHAFDVPTRPENKENQKEVKGDRNSVVAGDWEGDELFVEF